MRDRQITNGHITSIMYHFIPIVTTPVVLIPQVIVTLVRKVKLVCHTCSYKLLMPYGQGV